MRSNGDFRYENQFISIAAIHENIICLLGIQIGILFDCSSH